MKSKATLSRRKSVRTAVRAKPISQPKISEDTPPDASLARRSLIDIESLDRAEIEQILALTRKLDSRSRESLSSELPYKRVALLFYESSTRTRVSFEFAAKALGATTSVVTATASSIEKGESLIDTGYTLQAHGSDCIVMRHPSSGAPHILARHLQVPIINAGDGMHEHPTQALLDAYTMLERKKSLQGLKVLIVGDILHSRVARSNTHLLTKMGARVTLCGPEPLLPELASTLAPGVQEVRDFEVALRDADVIMLLRVQKERLEGLQLNVDEYIRNYQLTVERLKLAHPDAIVMHPGPMIRGMEIVSEVADSPRAVIQNQVRNGVSVRMAALLRALKDD
ncbi:MAG TPA: aspartate carbamoyltransferase catalytic subunit [Terriglobales bacterium]